MLNLDEQLRMLVQTHGVAEIRRRLSAIARPTGRLRIRKSACEYVLELAPLGDRREKLLVLGRRFEEKSFLPTSSDIRNLFEAYGVGLAKVKSRQDAMPLTFRFLATLSVDQLDRIVKDGLFSGPSELGPIADAIKARSSIKDTSQAVPISSTRVEVDLGSRDLHKAIA